jgi:hypothetical protein
MLAIAHKSNYCETCCQKFEPPLLVRLVSL